MALDMIEPVVSSPPGCRETAPRRRSDISGLNRVSSKTRSAAPYSSNRLGEIRDRSYENQRHRASGLRPARRGHHSMEYDLPAARRRSSITQTGAPSAHPGDLAHLSPLGWEHINLTGDYHWDIADPRARSIPAAPDPCP